MLLVYRGKNDAHIDVSESFFEGMRELKVLDFSGMCLNHFPSSIQVLENLYTLCLDRCIIQDLAIIGELKQLQILTFRGSEIARLPKEIGELSKLKVLNLSYSKLEIIEPQVLGRLTSLEELHMMGSSFKEWEDEEEKMPTNSKLSELNNTRKLSCISLHIRDPSRIPKKLEFQNLVEYIINIGDGWDWSGDFKESRTLKIKLNIYRNNMLREKWAQNLLKCTQHLQLDGLEGRGKSFHELCLDGFQELKHLYLQNSSSVHFVTQSINEWLPCTTFTVLETLLLENLTGLEMISQGPVAPASFKNLKVIKVISCGKLEHLFSYSMLKVISQLEEIEVRDCETMKHIVDSDDTNIETVRLQALHRIELHKLPNLTSFYSRRTVEVDQCISTDTLFLNEQISLPLLKSLILSSLPKLKYIWQNNCPIEVTNLEYLEVRFCNDLTIVIPSNLVEKVKNLNTLMVRHCGSVKELFESSDVLNLTRNVDYLSRLYKLYLYDLPCLTHIWKNNNKLDQKVKVFQNLIHIQVVNCNALENLLPVAVLKGLGQIKHIRIWNCEKIKEVVPAERDTTNILFKSLVSVWLKDLPNMVTFMWANRGESIRFPALQNLCVQFCPKMRAFSLLKEDSSASPLCFFDEKVLLPSLAELFLFSLGSIQKIWHEEIPEQSYCQLEKLDVRRCENLVHVIPFIKVTSRVEQLHSLKEIIISQCTSLVGPIFKFVAEEKEDERKKGCSLPQLEKLLLVRLPKLEHVIQPTSHVTTGFPSLVEILVDDCQSIIDLFPVATTETLSKLKRLEVRRCGRMTHVFGKEDGEKEEYKMVKKRNIKDLSFPCLHSILLEHLDSLICFFLGATRVLEFPALEYIDINMCMNLKTFAQWHTSDQMLEESTRKFMNEGAHYLFDDKVEFPKLMSIKLVKLSNLHAIWKTHLDCLGEITFIFVNDCEKLEALIIFESDDGERSKKERPEMFHSLVHVQLQNLPNMISFLRARRHQSLHFLSLEKVLIESCPKMSALSLPNTDDSLPGCFFHPKVQIPQLTSVGFISMGGIGKIWHNKTAEESLSKLEILLVTDCQNLVTIFPTYNRTGQVGRLQLQNLTDVMISQCNSLEGSLFPISSPKALSKLETLRILKCRSLRQVFGKEEEGGDEEEMLETIVFPCLRSIQVANLDRLMSFFLETSLVLEFPSLEYLDISMCRNLKAFAQRHTTEHLEELANENIPYLFDDKVVLPNLRKMKLFKLSNLHTIWKNDLLPSSDSYTKLKTLLVSDCEDLQHIFPATLARKLLQLEDLIVYTSAVDEIVRIDIDDGKSREAGENSLDQLFFFPQLTTLVLCNLPNLRRFFRGSNACTWPALKNLFVLGSDKVQMFTSKIPSENTSTRQSLFSAEKVIPFLDWLTLVEEDAIVFQNEEFNDDIFSSLRALTLSHFHGARIDFPSRFLLESFQKLESLIIHSSLLEEIFPNESLSSEEITSYKRSFAGEGKERPFASLKLLKFSQLPNLKQVWKADTMMAQILKGVQSLEVWNCSSLTTLFPTVSASFGNITKLEVHGCNRLRELMTASTATSLLKLTQLDINDCERIGEIVACEKECKSEDSVTKISFPELQHLGFRRLPSLTSFSSINCVFEFVSLEEVIVMECPNYMDIFSHSSVVAPKLSKVKLKNQANEDEEYLDGDLNTTIQNLISNTIDEDEEYLDGVLNTTIQNLISKTIEQLSKDVEKGGELSPGCTVQ